MDRLAKLEGFHPETYLTTVAMGIRGEADCAPNSIALARLLTKLSENPSDVSRDRPTAPWSLASVVSCVTGWRGVGR